MPSWLYNALFQIKMEEKYLSVVGGQAKQDPKTSHGPSQEQVLAWVDEVFHDLRQNKVRVDIWWNSSICC